MSGTTISTTSWSHSFFSVEVADEEEDEEEDDEEDDEGDEEEDTDEDEDEDEDAEEAEGLFWPDISPASPRASRQRVIFEWINGEAAAITTACAQTGAPPRPGASTRSHSSPRWRMDSMQERRFIACSWSRTVAIVDEPPPTPPSTCQPSGRREVSSSSSARRRLAGERPDAQVP